jgi:hypothetical protein
MTDELLSPETTTELAHLSVALLGAAGALAALVVFSVGVATAIHVHRSRAAIARMHFGEIDVRTRR